MVWRENGKLSLFNKRAAMSVAVDDEQRVAMFLGPFFAEPPIATERVHLTISKHLLLPSLAGSRPLNLLNSPPAIS
jgi:hypothetical protein